MARDDDRRDRSRSRSRERERDRSTRDRDRDRDRDRERDRDRRSRERSRERGDRDRPRSRQERSGRSRSRSRSRDRDRDRDRGRERERERDREKGRKDKDGGDREPAAAMVAPDPERNDQPGEISLSIEETNKLRAQLGLRPLDTGPSKQQEEAERWRREKEQAEKDAEAKKLMEKIFESKQKREMAAKLAAVRKLADEDDEADDVLSWVQKSRKKEEEKKLAEKQAKMFEEMDDEFGISDLVESTTKEEEYKKKQQAYTGRDLKGLAVEHKVDDFKEGVTVLTLKDHGVLDDDDDVLENVNLVDDVKAKENIERKKGKPVYSAYDDDEFDEHGNPRAEKKILSQYDEEIEGKKVSKFVIGDAGVAVEDREEAERRKVLAKLKQQQVDASTVTLSLRADTLSKEEVAFKKPAKKKVRKVRKKKDDDDMLKVDDLVPLTGDAEADHGARGRPRAARAERGESDGANGGLPMDVDPGTPPASLPAPVKREETVDDIEDDYDLQIALARARRLKMQENLSTGAEAVVQKLKTVKDEPAPALFESGERVVLSANVEAIRTLGDTAAERAERPDIRRRREEARVKVEEKEEESMEVDEKEGSEAGAKSDDEHFTLIEEKSLAKGGLAAALAFAMEKGFVEQSTEKESGQAGRLIFEDDRKRALQKEMEVDYRTERERERDKYRHRGKQQHEAAASRDTGEDDRGYRGTSEFKEKEGYNPDVKLEYFDQYGWKIDQKDAFRLLSERFHGKQMGKNKVEKMLRKRQEELALQKMSNTDTPLNTVERLREKQKATGSAYVVLSNKPAAGEQQNLSLEKEPAAGKKGKGGAGSKKSKS